MNIFFDVDYTILGMDDTLRPGTRELFEKLKLDGHTIYIWSGNGIRWVEVRMHNLEGFVTDCFEKPLEHFQDRIHAWGIPQPDLVIDDYPEIVRALGGIRVQPYYYSRKEDGGQDMERVYQIIQTYIQSGHSSDSLFTPPNTNTS